MWKRFTGETLWTIKEKSRQSLTPVMGRERKGGLVYSRKKVLGRLTGSPWTKVIHRGMGQHTHSLAGNSLGEVGPQQERRGGSHGAAVGVLSQPCFPYKEMWVVHFHYCYIIFWRSSGFFRLCSMDIKTINVFMPPNCTYVFDGCHETRYY